MCVCVYVFIVVYLSTRAHQTCYVLALQQIMSILDKIDKLKICGLLGEVLANREISRFHEHEIRSISVTRLVARICATRFIRRCGLLCDIIMYTYTYTHTYMQAYMYVYIYISH